MRFPGSLSLIRQKKEEAILEDWSANGRAKGVADQLAGNIGETILQLRAFVEPVIGLSNVGAVVFVSRTMKAVGPAFCDQRDLGAGGTAFIGIGIAGGYAKLLQRIQRRAQRTLKSESLGLIIVVDAVEHDVRLIASRSV